MTHHYRFLHSHPTSKMRTPPNHDVNPYLAALIIGATFDVVVVRAVVDVLEDDEELVVEDDLVTEPELVPEDVPVCDPEFEVFGLCSTLAVLVNVLPAESVDIMVVGTTLAVVVKVLPAESVVVMAIWTAVAVVAIVLPSRSVVVRTAVVVPIVPPRPLKI